MQLIKVKRMRSGDGTLTGYDAREEGVLVIRPESYVA